MRLIVDRFFSLNTVYFVGFNFCDPWKLGGTRRGFHVFRDHMRRLQLFNCDIFSEQHKPYGIHKDGRLHCQKIREHGSFLVSSSH